MSVAQLKKLSLVGRLAEKTTALEYLQDLGCMHLVPLSPPAAEPEKAATREAAQAYKALRFLADVAEPRWKRLICHGRSSQSTRGLSISLSCRLKSLPQICFLSAGPMSVRCR